MKKYIRGFFMAWGNFCAVPCPSHKWYEESRKAMLAMLPLVGLLLAVIVGAAWWALDLMGVSPILTGVILTVLYFCCNGFIHLDGFMDCSDAILSRRPELEERQRILKASDVGAFAVICLMLMMFVFTASMIEIAEDFTLMKAVSLAMIMLISRGMAADHVFRKPSMSSSQYVNLGNELGATPEETQKRKAREQGMLNLAICVPILIIPNIVPHADELFDFWATFAGVGIITMIAAILIGKYAIKQLGGMNGDIAGCMVVMSEVIGMLSLALITALL